MGLFEGHRHGVQRRGPLGRGGGVPGGRGQGGAASKGLEIPAFPAFWGGFLRIFGSIPRRLGGGSCPAGLAHCRGVPRPWFARWSRFRSYSGTARPSEKVMACVEKLQERCQAPCGASEWRFEAVSRPFRAVSGAFRKGHRGVFVARVARRTRR